MSSISIALNQSKRVWTIAKKDIRIYYSKGPVVIFGIIFPAILFLTFMIGRKLPLDSTMPGLMGMILFFSATAISPAVVPWEAQARTLERLLSAQLTTATIIMGDILASFMFGTLLFVVPLAIGIVLGMTVSSPLLLAFAVLLSSFCFSSLGVIFSAAPTNTPSNIMMLASVVKLPLIFISGVFIPLDELPAWGKIISFVSPLTYFTDTARHLIQGEGCLPVSLDLLVLFAFTVFFLVAAMKMHAKTMRRRI
jgi:ABC-2 type transport system permease protein